MAVVETYTKEQRAERERIRMECRVRHDMGRCPAPPEWERPASPYWRGAKLTLHKYCSRCGTWRHIALNHRGGYLTGYYDYPDWYLQEPGEGRVSSDAVRLWEVEQVEAAGKKQRLRRVG
jgi:hypothetical protein